jgi:hypothetical protein
MTFHFVKNMEEVLTHTLVQDVDAEVATVAGDRTERVESPPLAH